MFRGVETQASLQSTHFHKTGTWFSLRLSPLRTLRRIVQGEATGIFMAPLWPSQPWYPVSSHLTLIKCDYMGPSPNLSVSPSRATHPLTDQLILAGAVLSGNSSHRGIYRKTSLTLMLASMSESTLKQYNST